MQKVHSTKQAGQSGTKQSTPSVAPGRVTKVHTSYSGVQCKAVQAKGGAASPDDVKGAASQGISGAGGALPHGDAIQRSFGRHDVSNVQAHVGGAASSACSDMGAMAFALGTHVAFKGQPDLHTAAHEAAHVVQQRAGVALKDGVGTPGDAYEQHADAVADLVVQGKSAESLLDRMAGTGGGQTAGSGSGSGVQMAVDTYGGTFDTTTYRDNSGTDASGFKDFASCEIELEFRANDLVVCPKFGFTQSNTPIIQGSPAPVRPEVVPRSQDATESDTGRYLDRAAGRENPMYGVNNQADGTVDPALGDGTNASNSRFGHREPQPDGTVDEAEAYLYDRPGRPRAPTTGAQGQVVTHTFETTALCLEGPMAGTYLGSVEWGYHVDADGNSATLPFRMVSMGAPTSEFMSVAQKWNDAEVDNVDATGAPDGTTRASIDLPITSHQTVDPATLSDEELHTRIRELTEQMLTMDRTTVDYQNVRFEARGLAREATNRGAAAADSGDTYTVQSGDTLWSIARSRLGGGPRWTHIFALNVVDMQDGNRIAPGQVLKMPVRE